MSRLMLVMSIYSMLCFLLSPQFLKEAMKDAQWVHANEEVNENDEVVVIDEQQQDVNALQEKLKYIHIFSNKKFQCAGKDGNQKNHV